MNDRPAAAPSITLGAYLGTRLMQLGVRHLFGLPGDFNLSLLDQLLAVDGLDWVGSANELNAAYAADGAARAGRHAAALVTTFGVGELSAVNGIAGSFAEDVPVIHIVGLPSRAAIAAGAPVHHSLLDGDFDRFVRVHREVTAAHAVLDSADPTGQIDRLLTVVLTTSKPVYLGVPLDLAAAPVDPSALDEPLRRAACDPRGPQAFARALRERLADRPLVTLLVGHRVHRRGLEPEVAELATQPGVRIASQPGSKAILDEHHPASLGTYIGAQTREARRRDAVDRADALVLVGTVFSDLTTGGFTHRFDPADAVELGIDHARIGAAVYPGVDLATAIRILRDVVAETRRPEPIVEPPAVDETAPADDAAPLTHDVLWREVQAALPPDSLIVADAGTAFYGALDLELPDRCDLLGQPVWSSIGFTIPATLGAGLARPDRRPFLFVGDGAAQLTVQELGLLYSRVPGAVVVLLDNAGYTVERLIQSPEAIYQDIVPWRWDAVPAALGADAVEVLEVRTAGDLRRALAAVVSAPAGSFFVRVHLDPRDAPRLMAVIAEIIAKQNAAMAS